MNAVIELPDELEHIKSILLYEILKNLPAECIKSGGVNDSLLIKGSVPMFYINKYKTNNMRLK